MYWPQLHQTWFIKPLKTTVTLSLFMGYPWQRKSSYWLAAGMISEVFYLMTDNNRQTKTECIKQMSSSNAHHSLLTDKLWHWIDQLIHTTIDTVTNHFLERQVKSNITQSLDLETVSKTFLIVYQLPVSAQQVCVWKGASLLLHLFKLFPFSKKALALTNKVKKKVFSLMRQIVDQDTRSTVLRHRNRMNVRRSGNERVNQLSFPNFLYWWVPKSQSPYFHVIGGFLNSSGSSKKIQTLFHEHEIKLLFELRRNQKLDMQYFANRVWETSPKSLFYLSF